LLFIFIFLVHNIDVVLMLLICSAVPFDEDEREASVWFLDHDYLENMYGMFKKVNGGCLIIFKHILLCQCLY